MTQTIKVGQPTRHIDALRPHPDNPRDDISVDDPAILELADSIIRFGIIEPLVITPDNLLIAGHRRRVACRVAAKKAGRAELLIVPVTIRDVAPDAALEVMLQENMQRASLTPLEEARAMYAIMDRGKVTVGDLARRLAIPQPTVSQRLSILKLEEEVQALYGANELPLNAANYLAHVYSAERQKNLAGMLARRTMTLQQLKEAVREERPDSNGQNYGSTATIDNIPKPRSRNAVRRSNAPIHSTESQPVITRAEAVAALNKILNKQISMHTFQSVLETVCCACGMKSVPEMCLNCPLPRLILGVVGRAELR